jgi:hypothetical protein
MLSLVRAATGIQKPDIEAHFAFAGYIDADGGFQGLQFKPLKVLETTQYGFKVEASEQDGRFVLLFIYSKAFYTEEIITLLARYYQNILRAVLEDKWVRLGDIELQPEFSMAEQ